MEKKFVDQSKGDVPTVSSVKVECNESAAPAPPAKQRRPANGFLGFCHRHRTIVSRRNKRLENRLVTKILGAWWSSLPQPDRNVYENRAREYKAVFMAANPGYQWYTKRESTGNTPVTRLSNRRGRKLEAEASSVGGAITPGKLADESQMGGLSSLMQFPSDQSKKKNLDMTNYIASEHDYLDTKQYFTNNNSITYAESPLAQCTSDKCEANNEPPVVEYSGESSGDTNEMSMDTTDEKEYEEVVPKEMKIRGVNKRKLSKPRKNPHLKQRDVNLKVLPKCPPFKEFMKACPTYSYDAFMERKAEMNTASKTKQMKRRKWKQALKEYGVEGTSQVREDVPPTRRRKRRRAGVAQRTQKRPRSELPSAQVAEIEVRQQATLAICPTNYDPSTIPFFNQLHILAHAAEAVELGYQ